MTIPKQTAITLLDRAKRSLLQELSDKIAKLEPLILAQVEQIAASSGQEAMLQGAKEIIRQELAYANCGLLALNPTIKSEKVLES